MKQLLSVHFSWSFLFITIIFLLLLYMILQIAKRQVMRLSLSLRTKDTIHRFLHQFLLLYELIFGLITASVLLFINPIWHGTILAFVIVVTFPLLRNYVIGRFLCFDAEFQTGKRIIANDTRGVINRMNRLGIYLMTNHGMQYINYTHLQEKGFSLLTDSLMEEYCDLHITALPKTATQSAQTLLYKLMSTPYLDEQYKPTLIRDDDDSTFQVRVLIRKGNHRDELIDLIEDWGYTCTVSH